MKRAALLLLALAATGCQSLTQRIDAALPEGQFRSVRAVVTGKFSSTTVEAEGAVKDGEKVSAERLHVRHSNAWVPLFEFEAEGYERKR